MSFFIRELDMLVALGRVVGGELNACRGVFKCEDSAQWLVGVVDVLEFGREVFVQGRYFLDEFLRFVLEFVQEVVFVLCAVLVDS